jgi:hypothetical protein
LDVNVKLFNTVGAYSIFSYKKIEEFEFNGDALGVLNK